MWIATLARDRVDRFDVIRAHVVELLVGDRHELVFADAWFQSLEGRSCRRVSFLDATTARAGDGPWRLSRNPTGSARPWGSAARTAPPCRAPIRRCACW